MPEQLTDIQKNAVSLGLCLAALREIALPGKSDFHMQLIALAALRSAQVTLKTGVLPPAEETLTWIRGMMTLVTEKMKAMALHPEVPLSAEDTQKLLHELQVKVPE